MPLAMRCKKKCWQRKSFADKSSDGNVAEDAGQKECGISVSKKTSFLLKAHSKVWENFWQ